MLNAPVRLFQNAYGGLPPQMWWQAAVTLVNRSGTMVIPFLSVYLTDNGYTLAQAGWVMGAFGAGSLLGTYLGGRLIDRIGFLQVQFGSLLLSGLFFIGLSFIQGLWGILIFVFVLSTFGEAYRPANAAAIAAYSHAGNRTRSYTLNRLAINLGWSVGPALGGLLASISYNWLFWVDGLTCIFAAFLLRQVLGKYEPVGEGNIAARPSNPAISPYRDAVFLKGMLLLLVAMLVFFQMITLLPVYYKDVAGLTKRQIGGVLALNGLVIALSEMLLVYWLEYLGGFRRYLVGGTVLIGLSFVTLTWGTSLSIIVVGMLLLTLGEMLLFPFINNFWVARSNEQNRGSYAAVFSMTFALAHILAPASAAQVAQQAGFQFLWWVNFGVCLLVAVGFYLLDKRKRQYD
jgi:predicted MFS family arabinose efflux permease